MTRKRMIAFVGVGAVIIAVVLTLLFTPNGARFGFGGTQAGELPSAEGSTLLAGEANRQHITLLVDGWSYKTLNDAPLTYTTDTGVSESAVVMRSTDLSDVQALLDTNPELVRSLLGRLYTVDPRVDCTSDGCSVAGSKVDLTMFSDPSKAGSLSSSFQGWGVDQLLYKVDVYVPNTPGTLTVSGEGWGAFSAPIEKKELQDGNVTPTTYAMSAGLGKLFTTDPYWMKKDAEKGRYYIQDEVAYGAVNTDIIGSGLELNSYQNQSLFDKGLSTFADRAQSLGDQQLTFMTSPTTGCGPGVLCVPTTTTTVERTEEVPGAAAQVCVKENPEQKAYFVSESSAWTYTYPAPTSQWGAWNGGSQDTLPGSGNAEAGIFQGGVPPLVEGAQTLWMQNAYFFTGATGSLWDNVGYVAQRGEDPDSSFGGVYEASDLGDLEAGYFTAC